MLFNKMLDPDPFVITAPGVLVSFQFPDAGNPEIITEPVDISHVGCVMLPTTGAPGVAGCVLITSSEETAEVQPDSLLIVNV